MKIHNRICLLALALMVSGAANAGAVKGADQENAAHEPSELYKPDGKGKGVVDHAGKANGQAKAKPGTGSNGITNHGGPVMLNNTNVYYIWYGNWTGNTATTILTDLASSVGGSSHYNINTTYYQGSTTKQYISNLVTYIGSTNDSYSQGTALSDAQIQTVVSSAISSGRLPNDTNGVYFVLTSADVTASSGFCTQYCGWHTNGTIAGSNIKYSFVGNPATKCPSGCGVKTLSPNGNGGADAMASIIMHELEETVTDPNLNAWYDSTGYENGDKCAWNFGATYTAANGALANMKIGTRDYYIQQNWVNAAGGYCAKQYP